MGVRRLCRINHLFFGGAQPTVEDILANGSPKEMNDAGASPSEVRVFDLRFKSAVIRRGIPFVYRFGISEDGEFRFLGKMD